MVDRVMRVLVVWCGLRAAWNELWQWARARPGDGPYRMSFDEAAWKLRVTFVANADGMIAAFERSREASERARIALEAFTEAHGPVEVPWP